MVRRLLPMPRLPLRALFPRITSPILPLTSRLRTFSPDTSRLPNFRQLRYFPARLLSSSAPSPHSLPPSPRSPQSPEPPPPSTDTPTLSQRLKHLIKTYGWYALGVYLLLMAADFSVAFAGVYLLGADQVSQMTEVVKGWLGSLINRRPPEPGRDEMDQKPGDVGGHQGLYAMLVLAYAIHKTLFLPLRVGLTAALTPRLVGWLAKRGWAGGAGTRRAALEVRERMKRGPRRT